MTRLGVKPAELAPMLGVSTRSVYRAIAAGEIPAERVAGCLLIPASWLRAKFGEPVEVAA